MLVYKIFLKVCTLLGHLSVRRQLFWPIALTHDFCYRVEAGCLTLTATRQRSCGVVEEMARRLSMATRRELKDAIRERYQEAAERPER
jgi:hypothetical protein